MTQIPGGQLNIPPDAEPSDFRTAPARPRVSLLALGSVVVGALGVLTCCLPVVAPVAGLGALGLAVLAFYVIRRSEGRLRGTVPAGVGAGLGVLAMVLGSVTLLLLAQVAATVGRYYEVVEIAQRDDQSELKNVLTVEAANSITKEELIAFRATTLDELGAVRGVDGGVAAWLNAYIKAATIGPTLQAQYVVIPSKSVLPVPVRFEKASASLVVAFDSREPHGKFQMGRVVNLAVVRPDGTKIWLIDPTRDPSIPAPAAPAAELAPPEQPAKPEVPGATGDTTPGTTPGE